MEIFRTKRSRWAGARWVALVAVLMLTGFGCRGLSGTEQAAVTPVTLEYWTVFANADALAPTMSAYRASHPQVKINVRKFRLEEYEKALVDALAEDRGPDIFSLEADWVPGYINKLLPMPSQVTVPVVLYETQGSALGATQESVPTSVTIAPAATITPRELKSMFVAVVADDVLYPDAQGTEQVWGLPLSLDTLALFYNRDILDRSGVAEPPARWDTFIESMKAVRRIGGGTGLLTVAGAGLGGAANIDRASDILALLMIQNGAEMFSSRARALFHLMPASLKGRTVPPGAEALQFYTDFSNPLNDKVYGWDKDLPSSFEMFARGQLAYFFGYSYHVDQLRARAPKLNYAIAPLPQLNDDPVNVANYWIEGVSRKSAHPDEAWGFIHFAATDAPTALAYGNAAGRPVALRALVGPQHDAAELLRPFTDAVLYAKTWYQGKDKRTAEKIFVDLIQRVIMARGSGERIAYPQFVQDAAEQMQATY